MSVTVGDVHVEGSLGSEKKRKPWKKYVDEADVSVVKRTQVRRLLRHDANTAKSPFPHEPGVLAMIRPDQMPRFLGALTDPHRLEMRTVRLADLSGMQNRVDPDKAEGFASGHILSPRPAVVVQLGRKQIIADGHHRLAGDWLRGQDTASVRFKNLTPYSNVMKAEEEHSYLGKVTKVESVVPSLQVVYGWASVIEKDGIVVTDSQGDRISESEMTKAAHDYMLTSRHGGLMHWQGDNGPLRGGEIVESLLFTKDLQNALGVDLKKVGWLIGYKVSDDLWPLAKEGRLPMFSIGGSGRRVAV